MHEHMVKRCYAGITGPIIHTAYRRIQPQEGMMFAAVWGFMGGKPTLHKDIVVNNVVGV
jgi:hypothetical protein